MFRSIGEVSSEEGDGHIVVQWTKDKRNGREDGVLCIGAPPYDGHFLSVPMVSAIERFRCIYYFVRGNMVYNT